MITMDKKDYKAVDDDKLVTILDDNIRRSIGYYDSQISRERRKVIDFYNATLPRPAHDGNSKYVSMDVYDAVESMKAALLETFSTGYKTVRFAAQTGEDVRIAEIATAYCDYVANRQNNLFEVMQSVIHDGLIARAGLCKVYWDEREDSYLEPIQDLTEEEFDAIVAQDNVEIEEVEQDELGLYSGDLRVFQDTSQVVIEAIAPEQFVIEPQAKSLDDVGFLGHRTTMTISELREAGYDEKLIAKIGDHEDVEMETDPEVLARHEEIGQDRGFNAKGFQDQVRSITVYELYIDIDLDGSGIAETYKVIKAGNVVLHKEKCTYKPFCAFVPLPIPHSFFGSNFGSKVVPIQTARTVLTRSILDHAMITNNPRYTVVKGGLTNPRELIDNRVGGIVNVSRPDAISPMVQAPLNPFIFQTIQMLDEDKEDTTGVSRLSQGLNKDAISKQNSAAMVEQLATMSQQRQKIIARNFANNFLKPLYQLIYQLVVENEPQAKIVEIAGDYVAVNPGDWGSKRDVTVEMHLGYGEQEAEAQKYLVLHGLMSQDPTLSTMYTPENQYNLMTHVMEQNGIKNVKDYLTPPQEQPPEQPDPAQEMAMQMQQKQMELQERQTAVAEMKAQMDAQVAQMKLQLEQMKAQQGFAIQSDNMDLKEAQLEHKQFVDKAELEIARNADDVRAIASPTG
jgi:hypothetical protein